MLKSDVNVMLTNKLVIFTELQEFGDYDYRWFMSKDACAGGLKLGWTDAVMEHLVVFCLWPLPSWKADAFLQEPCFCV